MRVCVCVQFSKFRAKAFKQNTASSLDGGRGEATGGCLVTSLRLFSNTRRCGPAPTSPPPPTSFHSRTHYAKPIVSLSHSLCQFVNYKHYSTATLNESSENIRHIQIVVFRSCNEKEVGNRASLYSVNTVLTLIHPLQQRCSYKEHS